MPSSTSLLGFVAAALVVLLIPGPAVLSARMNASTPRTLYRLFADRVVVSVLSPKIAIFFLAFLPQFVEPSRGPVPGQVLFLGLIYVTLALFTDSAYALLAGSLRHQLGGPLMEGALPRYASGALYIGLGVSAALTGRRP